VTLVLAIVVPAAILAGAIAAISGFGIGSLLTPLLAVAVGTKTAVLLVSLPHATATSLRFWILRRAVDRRVLLTFGAASAIGGLAGALLHDAFGSRLLEVILGTLLIFAGVSGLTGLSGRLRIRNATLAILAGLLSAGFGGLVGNQGGIRSASLLHFGLSREAMLATATGIGVVVDLARIPVYLASGWAQIAAHWQLVAVMAAGAVIGTLIGTPVMRRVPERAFRRIVFSLVTVLGVALEIGVGG
jgi:uncharacterized membrane protein YfcA